MRVFFRRASLLPALTMAAASLSFPACSSKNPFFVSVGEDAASPEDGRVPSLQGDEPMPMPGKDAASASDVSIDKPSLADAVVEVPVDAAAATAVDAALMHDGAPDGRIDARPVPVVSRGLVAYLRFDEGTGPRAADDTGNDNAGQLFNGTEWTGGFSGLKFGNLGALSLDGVDDFVELTNHTLPAIEKPKTVSLWFSTTNPGLLRRKNLLTMTNAAAGAGLQLGFDGGRISAWAYDATFLLLDSHLVPVSGWHHVAYTYDGSTHRLYVDGSLAATSTQTLTAGSVTSARVGSYETLDEMYDGLVDDLRIYDLALTTAEIAALASGQ